MSLEASLIASAISATRWRFCHSGVFCLRCIHSQAAGMPSEAISGENIIQNRTTTVPDKIRKA
jgi:hypothetical protein